MSTTTATGSLSLVKGEKLDITKTNPGVGEFAVGLGWDANAGTSGAFDLDASCILLNKDDKMYSSAPNSVVYFGNLTLNGVTHTGDNLTGVGDGDDETVNIDFAKVPADVEALVFVVNIFQADQRRQNFGMVKNAFMRIYDKATKQEIARFDLSEDYSSFDAVVFGKLYRNNGEWKFQAVGEGKKGDLNALCAAFG